MCLFVCVCAYMWIDALDGSQWPPSVPSLWRPIMPRHNILWANRSWSQTCYLSNYPECFGAAWQAGQAHALWHTAWGEGKGDCFSDCLWVCVGKVRQGGMKRRRRGGRRGGGGVDDDRLMGKAEAGGRNTYAQAATVWLSILLNGQRRVWRWGVRVVVGEGRRVAIRHYDYCYNTQSSRGGAGPSRLALTTTTPTVFVTIWWEEMSQRSITDDHAPRRFISHETKQKILLIPAQRIGGNVYSYYILSKNKWLLKI